LTPAPIPTIPQSTWIRINEIHADPHPELGDATGDGFVHSDDDEFIELVNAGSEDVDLSGWSIKDEVRTRFVFPENITLKAGCGLVIFGGEIDLAEIQGSRVFWANSLGLNNTGDTLFLLDNNNDIYLSLIYGPEGGQDQSLVRFPDLLGDVPLILHGEIPEGDGSLFSAGTRVDGTSFNDCQ
jgi:hypothetical protein